jgi:tetratricopeptide (TPR) repeat protein
MNVVPKFLDARGHPTTAANPESVRLLDHTIEGYLGARADTRERLDALLSADPDCVMGHCLDGYFCMLSSKRNSMKRATVAVAEGGTAAARVHPTRREQLHLAALGAWSQGDMRGAVEQWDAVLAENPRDIVALKVSQFVLSYLGESERMRDTVAKVLPDWDPAVPGYGFTLGCYAYGLEESGEYSRADEMGRRAVELNPGDIWAAHAVAHVAEMEGRLHDGIAWIGSASHAWDSCNNFALHLRWHEGLLHLDLERYGRVLELYDREVRRQETDEYLDVTNAVSLLWRLEQAGVDVGGRWRELGDCSRGHVSDHALVFADLHYLMALAAVNDAAAIDRFLDSCRRFARSGSGTEATVMTEIGLPLAHAVLAHRRGSYGDVVDTLMPLRRTFRRIGASHAQRDVFDQLLIDSAWRGRRLDAAAELLAERTARRPRNIWAWKHYADVLEASGATSAAAAAAARATLDGLRAE